MGFKAMMKEVSSESFAKVDDDKKNYADWFYCARFGKAKKNNPPHFRPCFIKGNRMNGVEIDSNDRQLCSE